MQVARALWYTAPGAAEIRTAPLKPPGPGEALVRTLWSGVSRGTERLVSSGAVGESERERMRAPLQEGNFPFPVKYGYCATGVVEAGPAELVGRTVFCLHPHQDRFVAPLSMLAVVPEAVPARRATLAANMETALNAHWDAGTGPGDRIAVIGAGVVGLLVAQLAARVPGTEVMVYDIDASRGLLVEALGATFVAASASPLAGEGRGGGATSKNAKSTPPLGTPTPNPSPKGGGGPNAAGFDVVFHASASAAGLDLAIALAGMEGTVVEMSWYGDRPVTVGLGGAFHSRRLRLLSSQVGQVSPGRRPRWGYARRLAKALALLDDPALDALVAEEIAFADAPVRLPRTLAAGASGLAPVIRY
jgi:threonine dehydrogenase-like Zn-dependent dehydrogenase